MKKNKLLKRMLRILGVSSLLLSLLIAGFPGGALAADEEYFYIDEKGIIYYVPAPKDNKVLNLVNPEPVTGPGATISGSAITVTGIAGDAKTTGDKLLKEVDNYSSIIVPDTRNESTGSLIESLIEPDKLGLFRKPSLASIEVYSPSAYKSESGILYNASGGELMLVPAKNRGNSSEGEYKMPESVTTIAPNAFSPSREIRQVILSRNLASGIDGHLFDGTMVESVEISPDNPNYISLDGILYDKEGKEERLYPPEKKGINEIPATVESFNIRAQVTEVKTNAFNNAQALKFITVEANNPTYSASEGLLYSKNGKTLIKCPPAMESTEDKPIVLPDLVEAIASDAFTSVKEHTYVYVPKTVKSVAENAVTASENAVITIMAPMYMDESETEETGIYKWWAKHKTEHILFVRTDEPTPPPPVYSAFFDLANSSVAALLDPTKISININHEELTDNARMIVRYPSEGSGFPQGVIPAADRVWFYDISLVKDDLVTPYTDFSTATVKLSLPQAIDNVNGEIYVIAYAGNMKEVIPVVATTDTITFTTTHFSDFAVVYNAVKPAVESRVESDTRNYADLAKERLEVVPNDKPYALQITPFTGTSVLRPLLHPSATVELISTKLVMDIGSGEQEATNYGTATVTICIPNTWDLNNNDVRVYGVSADGKLSMKVDATNPGNTVTVDKASFTVRFTNNDRFSEFAIVLVPKTLTVIRGQNVPESATATLSQNGAYFMNIDAVQSSTVFPTLLSAQITEGAVPAYFNIILKDIENNDVPANLYGSATVTLPVPTATDLAKGSVKVYSYTTNGTANTLDNPGPTVTVAPTDSSKNVSFTITKFGEIAVVYEPTAGVKVQDTRSGKTGDTTVELDKPGPYTLLVADSQGPTLTNLLGTLPAGTIMTYYDIRLVETANPTVNVTDFGKAKITIPLPSSIDLTKGTITKVYTVNSAQGLETLPATTASANNINSVTFTTTHFSEFGIEFVPANANTTGTDPNNQNSIVPNGTQNAIPYTAPVVNPVIEMGTPNVVIDNLTVRVPTDTVATITSGAGVRHVRYVDMPRTSDTSPVRTIVMIILAIGGLIMLLASIPIKIKE